MAKEPQGAATSRPICPQCSGRGQKWVRKKAHVGKDKYEEHVLSETCPKCNGSGWL